ncbi:MAG: DNA/RNA nuclease SfsA [Lachnospirales bacterium]
MYIKEDIVECIFLERLNRFVGRVLIDDNEILVHIKNTGRCKELLIEGVKGYLLKSNNEKRKYMYDLIAVYKGDILVNIDSQLPNSVVYNYIKNGNLFKNILEIKREVTYKNSRFDIYLKYVSYKNDIKEAFIEVKGVTLFDDECARFPDAPTLRGTKHLNELIDAKENGYDTYVFFLIQADGIKFFSGNIEKDKVFCDTLKKSYECGVNILCYNSSVTPSVVTVKDSVELLI